MQRPVRVHILGQEYLIRSDAGEERVKEIAAYVGNKFMEVEKNSGGISERKRAILAAFYIAADYFSLLEERETQAEVVQKRVENLNKLIDSVNR